MPTRYLGGTSYFVTFNDDKTWKVKAYALKSKDETFSCFQKFLSSVETQSNKKLKALHTNIIKEYIYKESTNFCSGRGTKLDFTNPYILLEIVLPNYE